MSYAKIVHYLVFGLLGLWLAGVAQAATDDSFDPRPMARKVAANVAAVQAFESSARHANHSAVLRCVVDKIHDARVILENFTSMATNMTKNGIHVTQVGHAPLDVPAQGVSEIAVMVAGVKSVSDSSALVSAARRCFAISEDTEIRWLPAVESAPVSTISAIGRSR